MWFMFCKFPSDAIDDLPFPESTVDQHSSFKQASRFIQPPTMTSNTDKDSAKPKFVFFSDFDGTITMIDSKMIRFSL